MGQFQSENIEVNIERVEAVSSSTAEEFKLDGVWSFVDEKPNPRWLWHAIDYNTGRVLAYVFG